MSERKNWYVLYTKLNREKKVLLQLTELGISVYCPMVTTIRQWSDRKEENTSAINSKNYIHSMFRIRPR